MERFSVAPELTTGIQNWEQSIKDQKINNKWLGIRHPFQGLSRSSWAYSAFPVKTDTRFQGSKQTGTVGGGRGRD